MVESFISKQHKPNHQFPFERFASTNRYTDFDFLKKDNDWIMYISDINGQFNLWRYNSNLTYEGQCSPYPLTNFIDHSIRHFFILRQITVESFLLIIKGMKISRYIKLMIFSIHGMNP